MTFDPDAYWTAQGPYLAPAGGSSPEQELVLSILRAKLHDFGHIISVIDVGCGQGRLAAVIAEELPEADYSGVDLAQSQLDGAAKVQPDGTFYLSRLQDFTPLADRSGKGLQWDLVICSEVLMHIPPADIQQAATNLLALAGKWLVTVDWTVPLGIEIAHWNWLHDYRELLQPTEEIPVGLQSIFIRKM